MNAPIHPLAPLAENAARLAIIARGARPRIAPLRNGVGARDDMHREWSALLGRFVRDGLVEYATMRRVRRLVEVYLSRLATQNPDAFADADEQLAFFLNAYNTIAVHQVLLHYPLASLRAINGAWGRAYPIGRRNLSLLALESGMLRAWGDPRVHAAITPAALAAPVLQPEAFSGARLQQQLDEAVHRLLADQRYGASYDAEHDLLWLPAALRRFGGDWIQPQRMPSAGGLLQGRLRPAALVAALEPYLPTALLSGIGSGTRPRFRPYDWALNEIAPAASGRPIRAF